MASETLQVVSWKSYQESGQLISGEYVPAGVLEEIPFDCLKISNRTAQPLQASILVIENPPITRAIYAISGQVRHQGVQGRGYLEMWNYFDHGRHFSRTLAERGPTRHLGGDSSWRPFVLPFTGDETAGIPRKIVLNVVLPGEGTIFIGDLTLNQFEAGENPLSVSAPGSWWDDRAGGIVGGILGSVIGVMGGLAGWIVSRGRSRLLGMGLLLGMLIIGVICLLVSGAALAQSQPYAVYYPLGLVGLLSTLISIPMLFVVKKRYEQLELRRLQAKDI